LSRINRLIEGNLQSIDKSDRIVESGDRSLAIVVSSFNDVVTERLLEGALGCLRDHGVAEDRIEVFHCPGAFEIPQVADRLAASGGYEAIICLGCVIRGETPHFEYVASASAYGIERSAQRHGIPMTFGVLTTDNMEQAVERAGGKEGNKGWDAALSALEMIELFGKMEKAKL
jgi:6,7-dimethyl-8-ribityllumazine synthase